VLRKLIYTENNQKRIAKNKVNSKICVYCGNEFKLESNSQRYCSIKCKSDAGVIKKTLPRERKCFHCNQKFKPSVHNQIYCSKECQNKVLSNKRQEKLIVNSLREKKCLWCDKTFIITGGNNRYCSSSCKSENEKKINKLSYDKNKVLLGGFNEERGCIECGLIFTASNGKQVFCSEQCKYKNQYRRRKESGNTGYDGEYMRKYHKQRRETDPQFNMIGRIRHRTRLAIKNGGFTKKSKTYEMLGCDWTTLKDHIEKQFATGMSWDNMNEWDLDHIYPLSWCSTIEELEIYSHYTNLQPLWRKDNLSKGNKFIG
jgi:hypothetical protein